MCYKPKGARKANAGVRGNHLTKGPLPGVNTLRILADLWAKLRVSRSGYKFEYFSQYKIQSVTNELKGGRKDRGGRVMSCEELRLAAMCDLGQVT